MTDYQNPADEFAPVRAVRSQVKLKLAISGPTGSGKTDGALALATFFGSLADPAKKPRILVVDSENRTSALYADRYDFDIITLKAPYTPERYKKAMNRAVDGGYDWLIVDSFSHEWEGEGGILRQKDRLDLLPGSNGFTNWAKLSPDHEAMIEFLKQIPIHTICTMRSKQAYVLEINAKGKQTPRKVGMEPIQRPGTDYEFTLMWELDTKHNAMIAKNRTTLFQGDDFVNLREPQVAQQLRVWLENAAPEVAQPEWKPELGTVKINSEGQAVMIDKAPSSSARPAATAKPIALIRPEDKRSFWIKARGANPPKTDEQVRIYLWEKFKIHTSSEIPAAEIKDAMEWAMNPVAEKTFEPGEERAREAASFLKVSESDLQYELEQAQGDWELVATTLSTRLDEETVAMEAMKKPPASDTSASSTAVH